jgi:transcriptional regulator with XRE-family HTH domain
MKAHKEGIILTLGEKILALRKQRGLSQEDLAAMLTITRQAISRWEQGEAVPDMENIVRLSETFGVTTDYLLKNSEFTTVRPPERQDTQIYLEKTPGYRLFRMLFGSGFIYAAVAAIWILSVFVAGTMIPSAVAPFAVLGPALFPVVGLIHWALAIRFRPELEQEEQKENRKLRKAMEDERPAHRLYSKLFRSGFVYYVAAGIYVLSGFLFDIWGTMWAIFVFLGIGHYAMAAWLGIDDDDD